VAWYQADGSETDASVLLRHLEGALRPLPGSPGGWDTVGAAVEALEGSNGGHVALVVDDAHTLAGTEAEEALVELVSAMPPQVHVILSGRRAPSFDVSRWRMADQLTEIGPDDLRFRSWEVEELFAHHYHQRLPPEDLASLARRTDGWAAGLALYHLATRHKTPSERRRVLDSLSRERDTRDYLARNVLGGLDGDQTDFLIRTSVLGRLSGSWCDALLGADDSSRVLAELVEHGLFLGSDDGGITYRQPDLLRDYLEGLLVERLGEDATRGLCRKAGPILEAGGAFPEALRAYCRAQDWAAADLLLGHSGDRVFDIPGSFLSPLPPLLADHDAWLLLAGARAQVRSGHWPAARATYGRAEAASAGALVASVSREERSRLAAWMDPSSATSTTSTTGAAAAVLRRAMERDPLEVARELETTAGTLPPGVGDPRLAEGFALFLAGHVREAAATLSAAADDLDRDSAPGRWGAFIAALLRYLVGDPHNDLPASLDALEDIAPPWLGRLLRQLMAGPSPELETQIAAARIDTADTRNPWIDLGLQLIQSLVQSLIGEVEAAVAGYDAAAELAGMLGAPVLASWAASGAALVAAAFDPAAASARARAVAETAETLRSPGAACLALLVSARLAGSPEWEQAARSLEDDGALHMAPAVSCYLDRIVPAGGVSTTTPLLDPSHANPASPRRLPIAPVLSPPPVTAPPAPAEASGGATARPGRATMQELLDSANALFCPLDAFLPPEGTPASDIGRVDVTEAGGPPLHIRRNGEPPEVEVLCLGPFSLVVDGHALDVSATKPRLRSLLYRLALDTGKPVHRDQLRYALWPNDNERTGTRNLQVAISALRQQLEYLGGPGTGTIVGRRGDAYLLDPGAGDSDLRRFEDAAERGRRARRRGQRSDATEALRAALVLYRGELLADEGLSEWVLDERDRLRLLAAETSQLLAECLLEDGDAAGAVEVAERGVLIDRYRDRLWRVMIEAHERNGNPAAAARGSRQYATILDELGVVGERAAER